jgi:acyl-CoA synthetase (AMP-forming)/AMP-acid ligase II
MATTAGADSALLAAQLLVPWWGGGTTVVTPPAADGPSLAGLLARYRPSHAAATPDAWAGALAYGWSGDPDLTAIAAGGGLAPTLAADLALVTAAVWQWLLCPEAAGVVTAHRVVGAGDGWVPLGATVGDLHGYVLDPDTLRPIPDGALGELCVAGDRLAGGWPATASRAAGRLVPDPYGGAPGARLLRTGELVRRRGDGQLSWHGRLADRVTIRGLPVVLEELRQVLTGAAGVADAAVVPLPGPDGQPGPDGHPGVAAFVHLAEPQDPAVLQAMLERRLPARAGVTVTGVPRVPRLPDGRPDPAALPGPAASGSAGVVADGPARPAAQAAPPAGPVAQAIAGVWSDLLKVGSPAAHADFFELGGHSLMLAELADRLSARFRVSTGVPIVELLERPTITEQAAFIDELLGPGERLADGRDG